MGEQVKFNCPKCGLEGDELFGYGMEGSVTNFFCIDCEHTMQEWSEHSFDSFSLESEIEYERLFRETYEEIREDAIRKGETPLPKLAPLIPKTPEEREADWNKKREERERARKQAQEEAEKKRCCKHCQSKQLVEFHYSKKMACPKCGHAKMKTSMIGDWD